MTNITDEELEKLNTPGLVVEVDRDTARDLGAFEEDALSEEDALAATEESSPTGIATNGSAS